MKKIMCIIFALLIFLPLISCSEEPPVPTDNTFGIVNYFSLSKLVDAIEFDDMKKLANQPSEKSYTVDKEYNIESGDVVITSPGVYKISGMSNEHSVKVALSYSAKSKEVTLILDGVAIDSPTDQHNSAIYSSGVELTVVLVGENSLSDGTSNEDKGVITVKNGSLTFDGIGTLNINTSSASNGIYTNGSLTINGGIFNIEANNHGIYSKGDMTVNGGEFHINSQRHGIKCGDSPEIAGDEANMATLTINGGGFTYDGTISKIYLDQDGKAPYDATLELEQNHYKVNSDTKITQVLIETDIKEGTYKIGLHHTDRGIYFSNNVIKIVQNGTIKIESE